MYKFVFKRIIDIAFSFVMLILVLPIFLLVAILIKINSKGPIFYTQKRLGKEGIIFKLIKFRTMTHKHREAHHQVYEGDPEVTYIGKFLRRYKIDELPQLFNVLKGDMSLVGPRPCLPELINKFNDDAFYRLKVRPGLTGLSQINGNIYLTWPQRWDYDKFYVVNLSFLLDLKIILKTIFVIFGGEQKFLNKRK